MASIGRCPRTPVRRRAARGRPGCRASRRGPAITTGSPRIRRQVARSVWLRRNVFRERLLAGYADELAVQVVGPRVIRTRESARVAATVGDAGLAVQADVVEGADNVVGTAGQQNRAAHHGLRAVRAGAR